jgi:hypothetical protein
MNLNAHGAACRCLLRLRENQGQPGISDAAFIAQFQSRYPEWKTRPGYADLAILVDLARELKLAGRIECTRDYERVLHEFRANRSILVFTDRAPEQDESALHAGRFATVLVEMNEDAFTLWCPYPSGNSATLPSAPALWWDRWLAVGLVLQETAES